MRVCTKTKCTKLNRCVEEEDGSGHRRGKNGVSALLSCSNGVSYLSVSKMRHIILTLICGVIVSQNLMVYSMHIDLKTWKLFVLVRIMVQ